jgi:hypothetical protein
MNLKCKYLRFTPMGKACEYYTTTIHSSYPEGPNPQVFCLCDNCTAAVEGPMGEPEGDSLP